MKTKVVIAQLGSPRSNSVADVRSYLKEFLGDPRVVDLPRFLWFFILNLFVLPFRPKKSAQAYSRIYKNGKFPLVENTENFCAGLRLQLGSEVEVDSVYLLGPKRFQHVFEKWEKEDPSIRAQEVIILPQFPQYSESTTASVFDVANKVFSQAVNIPSFRFVSSYYNLKSFILLSAAKINNSLKNEKIDSVVISFHGLPLRRITEKKDQYYQQCLQTYEHLKQHIEFDAQNIHVAFQSRFGREEWIGPATDDFCKKLVEQGKKNILVYCPSFVVDCLETTDEIGHELAEEIASIGGKIHFIECLNSDKDWVVAYADYIKTLIQGDARRLAELSFPDSEKKFMPESKKAAANPLSPKAVKTIKVLFLTLFLDLVGFSIIFPMFPSLAKYYLEFDSESGLLKMLFGHIENFTRLGGTDISTIVLFGGALGALYSLLQFIFAPIWGVVSDKYGRRPILLLTMFAMGISYLIWGFAGSFILLLIGRIIGGAMGGNLSVATAAIADVTDDTNRSKGMAWVGIAFALGFIFGPALGGLLSLIDLTEVFPQMQAYGINPFSTPAFFAMLLSFINLVIIYFRFEETLAPELAKNRPKRSNNPIALLSPLPYPGINSVNYAYFFFISAFSGMEFTLTFLAFERLGYSTMDNAYMFIFIGFFIAFTQGGYVRRKAHTVGEKKMAVQGLTSIVPGLILLAFAKTSWMLYFGLAFLAVGSAMAIPTLTALSSLYAPKEEQGRALGVFRSLGSLGRVIGPIVASLIYWRLGGSYPYLIGAVFMIIPVLILLGLRDNPGDKINRA